MDYDNSATCEYLKVIKQHVIYPLEKSSVGDSCYAAALLIFGSIDGLGKLICPDEDLTFANKRFKLFLSWLGTEYTAHEDDLWSLRNSLAHNAMNVACFMSKTDDARGEHLEKESEFMFVHTVRLLEDFNLAIDKLEAKFKTDDILFQRSESRLEWDLITEHEWRKGLVMSTPPPGIQFVRQP